MLRVGVLLNLVQNVELFDISDIVKLPSNFTILFKFYLQSKLIIFVYRICATTQINHQMLHQINETYSKNFNFELSITFNT